MIDKAMTFLADELNAHLSSRHRAEPDTVLLSSPATRASASSDDGSNNVIVSLINVERDNALANSPRRLRHDAGNPVRDEPPMNISLILLISANYESDYPNGLRMLSLVLNYLHAHPLFSQQTSPDLPAPIDRILIEWRDMDLQALHDLWSVLGGQYLPSVVYRARLSIREDG